MPPIRRTLRVGAAGGSRRTRGRPLASWTIFSATAAFAAIINSATIRIIGASPFVNTSLGTPSLARLEPKLRGRELHGAPRRSRRVTTAGRTRRGRRGPRGPFASRSRRSGHPLRRRRNAVQDGLRLVVVELVVRPDHRPTEPRARSPPRADNAASSVHTQDTASRSRPPSNEQRSRKEARGACRSAAVGEVHGGAAREPPGRGAIRPSRSATRRRCARPPRSQGVVGVHVGVHVGARVQSNSPNGHGVVDVDASRRIDAHRPYPTHVHPPRQLRVWYAPRGLFIVSIRTHGRSRPSATRSSRRAKRRLLKGRYTRPRLPPSPPRDRPRDRAP